MNKYVWAGLVACLSVSQALAGEVTVGEAWARATAPGQDAAAVSMRITSQRDASIVAVSSPVANSAEIHSMVHEDGMMKMRALDVLPLKAGREVALGDGGNHLMLIGLKKPLAAGDSVELTVTVQFADKRKEKVEVKAEVRPLTATHDHMHMHHH
ncbi:MAG: copper chaperone PCu(A)C [Gallionellaceae bacterium]|nr:MAG: copper chaperone PCu(A)C [Gallionellaceae bacterium]